MKSFFLLCLALCAIFAARNTSRAATPEPSAPAVAAYDQLHQTEVFALGGVGRAGTTSPSELAFREVVRDENGAAAWVALLDDETTTKAGKLYALLGLREANRAQFEARLPAFLTDDSKVTQFRGCLMMPVRVKEIAASFVQNEAARA